MITAFKIFPESHCFSPPLLILPWSEPPSHLAWMTVIATELILCLCPCSNIHLSPFQSNLNPEARMIWKCKSDHIPPLSTKPSYAPFSLKEKAKSLQWLSRPYRNQPFSLPLSHLWPSSPSSTLFQPRGPLYCAKHVPAPGPLHLLFSLQGWSSPRCPHGSFPHLLQVFSQMSSPVTLCKIAYTTILGISYPLILQIFLHNTYHNRHKF